MLNGNRVIAIRARVRRGWSIKKIARTCGVSRNTVRRYRRQGATPCGLPHAPFLESGRELELVRRIARRYHTPDPDELESVLTLKLAEVYPQKTVVDDWHAFLWTALDRAAMNWLRGRRRQEGRVTSFDRAPPSGEPHDVSAAEIGAVVDVPIVDRLALERARRVLSPFLRRVWDALIAAHLDQTKAAQLLGVHRNTVRKAIRQMRIVLMRHDF